MQILSRHICLVLIFILMGTSVLWAQKTYYDEALSSWEENVPPPETERYHSILLIGDIKYPATDSTLVMFMKDKLNEIGDKGLVALSNSTKFPNLVAICIDNNFGTREGRGVAKLGPNFKKLQSLNI